VAYLVAIGIGLHNLGEGLAIGSAQAVGAIALSTVLVIGFALHNLTEGIGIVAPAIRTPPSVRHLLALGAIAGLPTIAGTVAGGFAYTKVLATFLLALGVGAILQVVWELARMVRRDAGVLAGSWVTGLAAGFVVMYATGLAIKS
jgi:zinc transporter ZupT